MTNAVGASGAINGMKRLSVTDERTDEWTHRREGGNSSLDGKHHFLNLALHQPAGLRVLREHP